MKKYNPISSYEKYCSGYGNPGNIGDGYLLGFCLEIGKVPIKFRHPGSDMLDKINAFDMAEATGTYIGQINMITVSSFCGPQGKIWGYDVARHPQLNSPDEILITKLFRADDVEVSVYSASPLIDATRRLFGTRDNKRFPLLPGAHVPCATKNISKSGPVHLYCAIGIGIPEDREKNACLLMEDIGELTMSINNGDFVKEYKRNVLTQLARSVLEIGENQNVKYKEIYVEMADVNVAGGEMGCALIAAPYFNLASNALTHKHKLVSELMNITLHKWESQASPYFLEAKDASM